MKTAIAIPAITVVLAAGVLVFLRPGENPDASRPGRSGRELRPEAVRGPDPDLAGRRLARLAALAETAPEEAEMQALELPGTERDGALEALSARLAGSDSARALRLAAAIGDPVKRGNALGFVLAQVAGEDPEAVYAWLAQTEEEEAVKSTVEKMALPALAEADPARAAHWIANGKVTARTTPAATVVTVQRWVQQDPAAAARWVEAFHDEQLLHEAVQPLIGLWMQKEPAGPAEWIESLPEGPLKDEACAACAMALLRTAPEEAASWAARISDGELGAETRRRIGLEE